MNKQSKKIALDKGQLESMYREKLREQEEMRKKLGDMYVERVAEERPLTDEEILRQNECCGSISLEVKRLKEMLDKAGD